MAWLRGKQGESCYQRPDTTRWAQLLTVACGTLCAWNRGESGAAIASPPEE